MDLGKISKETASVAGVALSALALIAGLAGIGLTFAAGAGAVVIPALGAALTALLFLFLTELAVRILEFASIGCHRLSSG
jgi:hypothetical protein